MNDFNWDFWGFVLGIIGIVLSLLTVLIAPFIDKKWSTKAIHYISGHRLAFTISIVVLAFIAWAIFGRAVDHLKDYAILGWIGATLILTVCALNLFLARENLETKLAAVESRPTEPVTAPRFKRFENIDKITYGHIAYSPLLWHDEGGQPQGVGITLLEMIFGPNRIEQSESKALWSDFVDDLASGQYDVVATPIFETQERSTRIAFCSPMFYSDVGMYVKKDHMLGAKGKNSSSFDEAVENVKKMNLQVVAIEGEISGKMALKYLGLSRADKDKWLNPDKSPVAALIKAINGEGRLRCEVAFAEVFQAEQTEAVKSKEVINILKPKALLYPVSFAVRKQDYVLKRYINLKLLELEETLQDGLLTVVYRELKRHKRYQQYTMEDIKRYFVRDYPEYGIREGGDMSRPSQPRDQEWQQPESPIPLLKGTRGGGGEQSRFSVSNDAYAEG